MQPEKVLIIDVDGLRPDVFERALRNGQLPGSEPLFGGPHLRRGRLLPVLSTAPSITFAAQASLFTGAPPRQHGVMGNEFFERFGKHSRGTPRHYAFDVGDTLSVDDAVRVFTHGLASNCLEAPTLYERLGRHGMHAGVVGHMYARGAAVWRPPSITHLARLTKGGSLFGLSAQDYDRHVLDKALDLLEEQALPDVFTIHFLGLDHQSHRHGPQAQEEYLVGVLDEMIARLWQGVLKAGGEKQPPLVFIFSDHGHFGVPPDDRHALQVAFPYQREIAPLFDALGLDVHDYPGEDPNSDAVVATNGGLAHVYLKNRSGEWRDAPDFEPEVLRVGRAFWGAHLHGHYAPELQGSLAGVLVRDVKSSGWEAPYRALTQEGELISLEDWFKRQPDHLYIDPVPRLHGMAGPNSGDVVLISDYAQGFYFSGPSLGTHGGLHPDDSWSTLAFGWPGADAASWQAAERAFLQAVEARCAEEGNRLPSVTDWVNGLEALIL